MDFYIWPEEQFRENGFIVFRIRSLTHPNSIALIQIGPHDYTVFKGEYFLRVSEVIAIYKLANRLMGDYFHYSS